jgi:uncharacterized membrane protein YbaN (DUF454 family)
MGAPRRSGRDGGAPGAPAGGESAGPSDPMSAAPPERPQRTGFTRALYVVLGSVSAAIGFVGAFVPVLPTTPFLLLAAAFFARSSPALHRRLLASRVFGPYIAQWQRDHTVPLPAKRKAYGLVVVTFTLSIVLVDVSWLRIALALLGAALLGFLAWLPTTERDSGAGPQG